MPTPHPLLIIIPIVVVIDLVIVFCVMRLLSASWHSLARGLPMEHCTPAPDAVSRSFQSMRIGMFNLGHCVHIAVDSEHLHLFPAWLLRRGGARPLSLPWDRVEIPPGQRTWSGLWSARVNGRGFQAPAWALRVGAGQPTAA